MNVDNTITPQTLRPRWVRFWERSAQTLRALSARWRPEDGAPVFTVRGRYTTRGWTDWTRGFQHGSALIQFDATGEREFLELGRAGTWRDMPPHVVHFGVHDHGFNCVSTYGHLWRLMNAGRIPEDPAERRHLELALKVSGCVQARRWTELGNGEGFVYSFNGPHSLFADTIRSMRSLALAHRLGADLIGEQDLHTSLLLRLAAHLRATARYAVFYGEGRDIYDTEPGRVAHESLFNPLNGSYRCPATQQGYSPFSTWTRGLAWVLLGFAEQLEFLNSLSAADREAIGATDLAARCLRAARATADFYLRNTSADGIPPWDTGAPRLAELGDWRARPADPYNDLEPFDSSAAAIAAQGLLRLARWLRRAGEYAPAQRYEAAAWTVLRTLLSPPWLSDAPDHEGLLLHAVYHRPNGWDWIPPGRHIPCGEACLWGDYHLREVVLLAQHVADGRPAWTFFGAEEAHES
ncbi:MAG: glycoside hydrolase family 88 protein [Kiritimatiellae bacterium]|nr:glycoside hydrolase family 88 protein [Kiritimatiellia bacterium]